MLKLDSEQMSLLAAMLEPGDPSEGRCVYTRRAFIREKLPWIMPSYTLSRIQFTVVSDPEDSEGDCTEIGTAEVDLNTVGIALQYSMC